MAAYAVGDKVWWAGEAWRITRIWNTHTEGMRADMESLERVELPKGTISASVNVGDVEGRLEEPQEGSE